MIWWIIVGVVVLGGFVAFTGAPYVPSLRRDIERALGELYPVGASDTLVDIGSGDGVVLRAASRRGARAIGYEIHPLLVLISKWLSRSDARVSIRWKNFWRSTLPDETTIVYTFGDGRDIARMYAYVEREATRLGRAIYFVSYAFTVPSKTPVRQVGAHYLYKIQGLQEVA